LNAVIDPIEPSLFWLEQHADSIPAGHDWLGARELEALTDLRFTRRRSSWRLGRWTAKLAVATRIGGGLKPHDVEIVAAADGAPEVFVAGKQSPVRVSISHTEQVSLCAVAPRGMLIGCDVETVEDRGDMFAHDYFVRSELERVLEERRDQRDVVETLVWSAKESGLKAIRDGLRRDTRDVVVDIGGSGGAREWTPIGVTVADGTCRLFGWWRAEDGRVYTVVTGQPCAAPVSLAHAEPVTS
jgi:phosphopantetheinyl transferase